jgi:4-hydroxythreonine-4-phosphate dehydrogenase
VGDPAGIGPEIVLKALASPRLPAADWVVYGPLSSLEERATGLGLSSAAHLGVSVVDVGGGPFPLGRVSAEGGRAAAGAVLAAARDALAGSVDGLVTAPLHKESLRAAGHPWPGHTEMLAEIAGTPDVAMMFVGGSLRVALLTIHRSLRSVPDAVTRAEVAKVVRLTGALVVIYIGR